MSFLDPLLAGIKRVFSGGIQVTPTGPVGGLNFASGAAVTYNTTSQNWDVTVNAAGVSQQPVTLGNGLNSNVATNGFTSVRVTGPTLPFSVGGLALPGAATPVGGQIQDIVNTTSQPMAIANEDLVSTAMYRLRVGPGVNAQLPPHSTARVVYDGTISRWVLQNAGALYRPVVDVREHGALGNANYYNGSNQKWYVDAGLTTEATDDTTAIQSALTLASALSTENAPAVVLLSGNHYLKTPPTSGYGVLGLNTFFIVPSNVVFQGQNSATLRVGPGLNDVSNGWGIFVADSTVSNVSFVDLFFDGNAASGSPVFQHNSFICLTGTNTTHSNIIVRGCSFTNHAGINAVILANTTGGTTGSNMVVQGNSFINCGNSSGLLDNVSLYIQVNGAAITGNVFYNDEPSGVDYPRDYGQAIQLQGTCVSITGNTFINRANAVLIASLWSGPSIQSQNIVVSGNVMQAVTQGVQFAQAVGLTLSDITISGNSITCSNDHSGQACGAIVCLNINCGTGNGLDRVSVVGNTLKFVFDARYALGAPSALNLTGNCTSWLVANNTFQDWPYGAIVMVPTIGSNPNPPSGSIITSDLALNDIKVVTNIVKDCGYSRTQAMVLACDTSSQKCHRIDIRDNSLVSTGSAIATGIAVGAAGSNVVIVGNITDNITTPIQLTSGNGLTNTITGPVVGSNATTLPLGDAGKTVTFTGQPELANSQYFNFHKVSTGDIAAIGLDTNNAVRIAVSGDAPVAIGAISSLQNATNGDLVLQHGNTIRWSGTSVTHVAFGWDDTNKFVQVSPTGELIQMGVGITAATGGSAATIGSGIGQPNLPTTAAQNGWIPLWDISGNKFWVPVWK